MSGVADRISEVTRRNILDELLLRQGPFYGRLGLIEFLNRVWDLSSMPSNDSRSRTALGDISTHMVSFQDWTEDYLLYDRLDILTVSDSTFGTFMETCVHPVVRDIEAARELVDAFNVHLRQDGFELFEYNRISGHPVYRMREVGQDADVPTYEVVLSFAGEERIYVEKVAETLKAHGVSVFYDRYEEATLWGKELTEHLEIVYSGSARYCVMFISQAYAEKVWTTHERRNAFEKALREKKEYVLPARFDDTKIPGLRDSVGYVDLKRRTPSELAGLILQKLGRT